VALAQREIVYLKPDVLVVYDRLDAGSGATHTWQLASPASPSIAGDTATLAGLVVRAVVPSSGAFDVVALPSVDADFQGGYRLDRAQPAGGAAYFLNVLSVDGAVTSVADAGTGADDGVAVQLAGGGTATVRFHRATPGGSLTLTGNAGSFDGALPSGVTAPALFAN
jgi:hypothetical protein